MVDVTLSLIGSNGDTIELADDGDFLLTTGVTGFGIPETNVRIEASAGNGGVWRFSKRGLRTVDLPIVVLGSDRADVETKLRRLARLLQDSNGPTRLLAEYSDGSSVYLDAHYTGGAETQFGEDAGLTYCRWAISLQAPQPFWESATTSSFSVTSGATGRGLLPQLTKLKVSSSQTLGVVSVNNVGDVETFPVWTILGPVDNLTISNGTQSFSYVVSVTAGQTITIDTENSTVVDDTGANLYGNLGAAPKLFSLLPGTTAVSVLGENATSATRITCTYSPRYEVVH